MQRSVLGGLAVWQGFVLLAALASTADLTADGVTLAIGVHLVLAVACALFAALRLPALPCLIGTFVGIALDLSAVSDWRSALVFAAIWTAGITCATPVLILNPRPAALVGMGAMISHLALQVALHPTWPLHLRLMVMVLGAILFGGAHAMRRTIDAAARRADEQGEFARRSLRTKRIARDTGRELAEDARVLHDTIINTLNFISRGARGGIDVDAVRRRAARDAAVVRRLAHDEARPAVTRATDPWLIDEDGGLTQLVAAVGQHAALPVDYEGPAEQDLERFESLLPVEASRAIVRAVSELVTNAAKHSKARRVRLKLELLPVGVVISVSDDGVGFTGEAVPGRGLAESVFRRCADANVAVSLDTIPGRGTTATLTYGMESARRDSAPFPGRNAELDARTIAAAGCWIWAGMMIAADLVLSVFRPPTVAATSIAVSLSLAVLSVLAWSCARHRREIPTWLTTLLVLSVPTGYLVPFAVVADAGQPLLFFPALVGTVPLVILMMRYRSRVPLLLALGGLGAAVVAASASLAVADGLRFPLAVVAAAPQLGLFAGWGVFVPVLTRAVDAYDEQLWAAFEADVAAEAQNALTAARQRWIRVGTRTSVALLEEIATGTADPRDPGMQQRCAEEESYLRQLLMIDADVLNLSPWLAVALVKARARSVTLEVRGGTIDSSDPATARLAGEALLTALDFCMPPDRLIVSLFTEAERPVCLILGPAGLAPALASFTAAHRPAVECIAGGSHTLISVRPPVAPVSSELARSSSSHPVE